MALSDIATEAAALVAGYALAVGQEIVDKTKTGIAERLYTVVRERLGRRASDTRALENLVREPANARHREVVAAALDDAIGEEPEFGEQLRREVMAIREQHSQVATASGPVAGNQMVSNIGPGVSISDAIVNNQGTVDQSSHTMHDRRRTTHKRGIPPVWMAVIVLAVGLVISGTTTYVIIDSRDRPPTSTPEPDYPAAAEVGGKPCTTDCPLIYETRPYEAVRRVYEDIATGDKKQACARFTDEAREQFAANLGFEDCDEAVDRLHAQVTDKNEYATWRPPYRDIGAAKTVRISSCEDDELRGDPPLGLFIVEMNRTDFGEQWFISGHEKETC